jgi:outer membrane lipoprotein LolB
MRHFLLLILLLTGCSSVPVITQRPAQMDAPFAFNGRVAFKQGEQRDSAGVRWVHRASEDEILLLAPLGQTVARIHRGGDAVTLEAAGKLYTAQDMETLMQQALGWQLPLSGLSHWVTAVPVPDVESNVERDAVGQVRLLHQQGWEITFSRYAAPTADALPLKLTLKREAVEVMLIIDEWEAQ